MEMNELMARMHSGRLYRCGTPELFDRQIAAQELMYEYNHTRPSDEDRQMELLGQMFASIAPDSYIEPPFHANWGGQHVHVGRGVYANFNLTLVDDGEIFIGDHVMIGPNVVLCSGTHPICPELRREQYQYNLPIHIGDNVWLGGGAFVMPGVTIGENSVIGAGSIVTRDIPANVIAVGNPCRVVRPITDHDRQFYDHDKPIDL